MCMPPESTVIMLSRTAGPSTNVFVESLDSEPSQVIVQVSSERIPRRSGNDRSRTAGGALKASSVTGWVASVPVHVSVFRYGRLGSFSVARWAEGTLRAGAPVMRGPPELPEVASGSGPNVLHTAAVDSVPSAV